MEQSKVDMFILSKGQCFPDSLVAHIREKLLSCTDDEWHIVSSMQFKSPFVALIFSIGAGTCGADRFYLGHTGLGVAKLILTILAIVLMFVETFNEIENLGFVIFYLLVVFGVLLWYFIDIFHASKNAKEFNYNKLLTILN